MLTNQSHVMNYNSCKGKSLLTFSSKIRIYFGWDNNISMYEFRKEASRRLEDTLIRVYLVDTGLN